MNRSIQLGLYDRSLLFAVIPFVYLFGWRVLLLFRHPGSWSFLEVCPASNWFLHTAWLLTWTKLVQFLSAIYGARNGKYSACSNVRTLFRTRLAMALMIVITRKAIEAVR